RSAAMRRPNRREIGFWNTWTGKIPSPTRCSSPSRVANLRAIDLPEKGRTDVAFSNITQKRRMGAGPGRPAALHSTEEIVIRSNQHIASLAAITVAAWFFPWERAAGTAGAMALSQAKPQTLHLRTDGLPTPLVVPGDPL